MTFRFIHTADWQIGKSFRRFPIDTQSALRQARLDAVYRIAELAGTFGATHVLVGGDIYDSEGMSDKTLRQLLEALRTHRRVVWHLLPGNHDPVRPGGVWDRVRAAGVPENVHLHLTPEADEIAEGVVLLPAPLRGRTASSDPTAWMDNAETPVGALRIGLAHGSIGRYGTDNHASVPIDPNRAKSANLDFLALGDDHGMKKINSRTWYSGTPEPDGWRQNDPGHVLCVTLGGQGSEPQVTPERIGKFAWSAYETRVDVDGAVIGLADHIDKLPAETRHCLVLLALKGSISLTAAQSLDDHLQQLEGQLHHIEVDRTGVRRLANQDDIASLGEGTELHKVGLRLMRVIEQAEGASGEAEIALLALNELIAYNEEHASP